MKERQPLSEQELEALVRAHLARQESPVGLPAFLKLWNVAYYPSQDCARGDADAKFPGQLGQVPVTKLKAQVPPHAGDNHLVGEPTSTKERMTQ